MSSRKFRIYAAGPFFNEQQLATLTQVEAVLESFDDVEVFKPRSGAAAAQKLNKDIGAGKDPSAKTRHDVFRDNVDNIDTADLIVAVADGRDIGTIFEIGYAFKAVKPIITFTNEGYGMNLMLAESVIAHCKGVEQLRDAVAMFIEQMSSTGRIDISMFEEKFKRANLTETRDAQKDMKLYREGK